MITLTKSLNNNNYEFCIPKTSACFGEHTKLTLCVPSPYALHPYWIPSSQQPYRTDVLADILWIRKLMLKTLNILSRVTWLINICTKILQSLFTWLYLPVTAFRACCVSEMTSVLWLRLQVYRHSGGFPHSLESVPWCISYIDLFFSLWYIIS